MIPKLSRIGRRFPRSGTLRRAGAWLALCAALVGPATPVQAADAQRGAALYATHCASCHGATGQAVLPGAPNFRRGEALMRPDAQLVASIRGGKNAMPAFFGLLDERQLRDLVAHLRTLQ